MYIDKKKEVIRTFNSEKGHLRDVRWSSPLLTVDPNIHIVHSQLVFADIGPLQLSQPSEVDIDHFRNHLCISSFKVARDRSILLVDANKIKTTKKIYNLALRSRTGKRRIKYGIFKIVCMQ